MNKKISTGMGVGIIAIVAVMFSFGIWKSSRQQNQFQNIPAVTQKLTQDPTKNKIQSADQNDNQSETTNMKADWITYKNDTYRFEIKYPSFLKNRLDLVENKTDNGRQYLLYLFAKNGGSINLSILRDRLDSKNIVDAFGLVEDKDLKKMIVGGKTSYEYRIGDAGNWVNNVRIPHGNETINISFGNCDQCTDVIKYESSILSTFKFIN